jgi:hypothetical protein
MGLVAYGQTSSSSTTVATGSNGTTETTTTTTESLGTVTDFFGKTVYEAKAPAAGVILYICAVPTMTKGGTIANVGVVQGSAK